MTKQKLDIRQKTSVGYRQLVLAVQEDLFPITGIFVPEDKFEATVEAAIDCADMHTVDAMYLAGLRQLQALYKKNLDAPGCTEEERIRTAYAALVSSESKCRRANRRLSFYNKHWSRRPDVWKYIDKARSIIERVLGPLDDPTLERGFDHAGFGNGSTFGSKLPIDLTKYMKLQHCTITESALPWLNMWFKTSSTRWRPKSIHVVRGNRVACVPKDRQKHRTIAVEPSLNVFLQKGYDAILKAKLRRFGVDLFDQSRNRRLAKRGSETEGEIATVDISAASDTLSTELVRLLLPWDWFILFDDLRCQEYYHEHEWHKNEKFSSMGNALTFPIETLIFWALALAVSGERPHSQDIGVYGDDIILPSKSVATFTSLLNFVGFSVNTEKSYSFGRFRESCGVDYLSGVNIRPMYVKRLANLTPNELFTLHNRFVMSRFGPRLCKTLSYLTKISSVKLFGPCDLGPSEHTYDWFVGRSPALSNYFWSDDVKPMRRLKSGAFGWRVKGLFIEPRKLKKGEDIYSYLSFLLGEDAEYTYVPRLSRAKVKSIDLVAWPSTRQINIGK